MGKEELKQEEQDAMTKAAEELETKVSNTMENVFGEPTETEETEEETDEESTPQPEKEPEKEPEGEADESEESEEESTSQEKESEGDKEGLPDAYVRAAVHQGWNEDEVKEFYQADPEKAKRTFGNIYNSTNRLSKEFAQLGKTAKEQTKQESRPDEKTATEAAAEQKRTKGFVDIDKLKEEYPDDPLIDQVIAPMNDALTQLNEQRQQEQPKQTTQPPQQQQAANTEAEQAITEFFDAGNLDNYSDVYGKVDSKQTWDDLTVNQQKKRWNVLNTADQIMSGAAVQGRDMATKDALNLAHMLVTEDQREQAIRNDIKKKVTKRSKGLSLKPGGDSSVPHEGKATGKQLEMKVANKLKEIYG